MIGGWYYANSVSLMTLLDSYRASGFIIVKIKIKIQNFIFHLDKSKAYEHKDHLWVMCNIAANIDTPQLVLSSLNICHNNHWEINGQGKEFLPLSCEDIYERAVSVGSRLQN